MTQKFPNVTQNDYIDTGILDLQDRDDAVLTLFAGENSPQNPFQDLLWNDLKNKCLKWYNNNAWETIIDYGKNYITESRLKAEFQKLNSTLTNYASVNVGNRIGFVTNTFIPISSYFINNLAKDFKGSLGLGSLAYKSKFSTSDFPDKTITVDKLSESIITTPIFKIGDVIPSFNSGNKSGCVKLSKSSNTVYTVGGTASNSTYKGDTYKNLFKFVWQNLNLPIYSSGGVSTSKSSKGWETDWNNNKRLELPHIQNPSLNPPKEQSFTTGSNKNYTVTKSGYYEITLVGGGGGGAGNSAGTWGHQSLCCGAAGAGFKGTILLNEGNVINYTIGTGGDKGASYSDWGNVSEGGAGGNSVLKLNGSKLVTCGGGGGGKTDSYKGNRGGAWKGHEPSGGSVTIHQTGKFSNVTNKKGADGYGTASGNKIEVNGPFNNNYGKGGSAQGFGDNTPSILGDGYNGYFNIKFLSPKEYGTTDSGIKNTLDNFYNGINYFMKH